MQANTRSRAMDLRFIRDQQPLGLLVMARRGRSAPRQEQRSAQAAQRRRSRGLRQW